MPKPEAVPSTAVAPVDEASLYLDGITESDSEADAKAIAARILKGTTDEEIFGGPGQLLSAEDLIGKAFTLLDVEYRKSDFTEGAGAYAILTLSMWGTTAPIMATCGARNVLAAAFRGKQLGRLPRGPLTIVEGKMTRKGFVPLWLQDMDRDTADQQANVKEASF